MTLNFESTPVLTGQLLELKDDQGQPLDLGFVGEVTKVDRLVIDNLSYASQVPFIPSMAETVDGQKLNVNADTVATKVARRNDPENRSLLGNDRSWCSESPHH